MTAMELVDALESAATEFGRLVDGTRPNQLGDPTPCPEFTVRDLINHVTGGAMMYAIAFREGSVPETDLPRLEGDVLGNDYRATYANTLDDVRAILAMPGAVDGNVVLPFGEMPRDAALAIAVFDVMVHAWDLATATGQSLTVSDAEAEAAIGYGAYLHVDELRDGSLFGPHADTADDASGWDRLIAYSGRTP